MTPKDLQTFDAALLSAFPTHDGLSRVLFLKLGWNLDEISGPVGLKNVTISLLRHAQATDQLQQLLEAVHEANPTNARLNDFYWSIVGSGSGQQPTGAAGTTTLPNSASPGKLLAAPAPFKLVYHCVPADSSFGTALEKQLVGLVKAGLIGRPWSEADIRPGETRDREIRRRWKEADFILLLVSANFLADGEEYLRMAEERHKEGASVVPIVVRATLWQTSWLGTLQAYPVEARNVKPISRWSESSEAWLNVIEALQGLAEERRNKALGTGV